jgi:spore maturation protein SpmA
MLNWIWASFFFVAFLVGLFRWLVLGEAGVWAAMVGSSFDMAKTGFEVSLGLTGVMCLWLGLMRLGEKGGAVALLARAFDPLLRRLFPGIPAGHPAGASIVMNLSANMLGLDNAATPLGLKAMKELQELNPQPDTASNDQILFLVINASAVTVIPTAIMTYRAQLGAADPTDVFIPLLIATFCSTMVGILVTAWVQRLPLGHPVTLAYLGVFIGRSSATSPARQGDARAPDVVLANFDLLFDRGLLLPRLRVPSYETFVEGVKEGFAVAVGIISYFVAMLVAVGVLRASGVFDQALGAVRWAVVGLGMDGVGSTLRWRSCAPVGQQCARLVSRRRRRSGRLCLAASLMRHPGQHRDHLLRRRRVLRLGRHQEYPPRHRVRPHRRARRVPWCGRCQLFVLGMIFFPLARRGRMSR